MYKKVKWDIKRGHAVYKSVHTSILQKWIKEGKVNEGEVLVWTSGMSGWRRPEELAPFKSFFKKKRKRRLAIPPDIISEKKKGSFKILIIDDEKDICWLLGTYLKKRRFRVLCANTGKSGIELVEKETPEIVLLDLRLGDMDGLKVLRCIKKSRREIKVIITSAFAGSEIKDKAIKLGVNGFVDKPFKRENIVKAINKL